MNVPHFLKSLAIAFSAILLIIFFWQKPALLVSFLIILALLKHFFIPVKKELTFFVLFGLLGSLGESVIMQTGAWEYASTQVLNFPIWLPFLWGIAGTTGIAMYEAVIHAAKR